jgi:hypothetical protein
MTRVLASALLITAVLVPAAHASCNDPFECSPHKRKASPPLTVERAKAETRKRAAIEASSWSYPGYVMTSFARCKRLAPRAINCGFSIYQMGGPPVGQQKSCHYTAHVILPRNTRHLKTAVEQLGCTYH